MSNPTYTNEDLAGALIATLDGKADVKKIAALLNLTASQVHNNYYKRWRPAGDRLVKEAIAEGRLSSDGQVVQLKAVTKKRAQALKDEGDEVLEKGRSGKKVKVEQELMGQMA